jgi:tetratricopeptide (TPR) repeat protein
MEYLRCSSIKVEKIYRAGEIYTIMAQPGEKEHKDTGRKTAGNGVTVSFEVWTNGHPPHASGNSRSIQELSQAIESNPSHIDEYFERAQAYIEKKEYQIALDDYNQVTKLAHNNASILAFTFACRGSVYLSMRAYADAIAECTKAIELDSASMPGYFNRGSAYFMQKQYLQAIPDFSEAIRLVPELEE